MKLQRIGALLLLVLGALLLFKTLAATWFVLLILAAAFAIGSATGAIGRWGYSVAALFAILAIPGFMFSFVLQGVRVAVGILKMAPWLLILVGIYMLFKSK